ncbi:O-antigen ligase [Novosphingobium sp. BW1]|uniref:O-antigen ligase family protein n=1 Tax=Novosphingobium sp. BW1 TaxID=2592621 RepID=UPI0011DE89D3|nr:O-antigen ligase family protein [Novosphingobium sp. BW1]TYC85094.1 O-antigen ligase family protein [Novosphingobium sp. BW1]
MSGHETLTFPGRDSAASSAMPQASRTAPPRRPKVDRWEQFFRLSMLAAYGLVIFISIIATNWRLGLPVRSLVAMGLLGALILLRPSDAIMAMKRLSGFCLIALYLSVLGFVLSLFSGGDIGAALLATVQISGQAVVQTLLAAIVAECCGARPTLKIFVILIGVTSLVAVLQFIGVGVAWNVRDALSGVQGDVVEGRFSEALDGGEVRSIGLSYSKTILAGQICLAFAAYLLMRLQVVKRLRSIRIDMSLTHLGYGLLVLAFVAIAGGNRSPLLGGAVVLVLFLLRTRPRLFVLAMVLCFPVILVANSILAELQSATDSRILQTGDNSSLGRLTLIKYGVMLFVDNPFGYGATFEPRDYALQYLGYFWGDPTKSYIYRYPLHNYVMSVANIYGVLALPVLFKVIGIFRKNVLIYITFAAYITHILFHNSGPFYQNEIFFWFVVGVVPKLKSEWRSAFGALQVKAAAPA